VNTLDDLVERELAHAESVTTDLRARLGRSQTVATGLVAVTTGAAGLASSTGAGLPEVTRWSATAALVLLVLAALWARRADGPVAVTRPARETIESWVPSQTGNQLREFVIEVKLDLREAVVALNHRLASRLAVVLRLEVAAAAGLALAGVALLLD
jgi:hypothetical protein